MIVFFVGTPGSGKSYDAVQKIIDNLRLGRSVCTNIDGMDEQKHQEYLKNLVGMDDYTFYQRFRFLHKHEVIRFWKSEMLPITPETKYDSDLGKDVTITEKPSLICPHNSLVIIDEAHKHFNSRDWQSKENRELADWASTHRHFGYDLVFITQSIDKVDKQVRSLTEWTYFYRKVNFFGGMVQQKYMKYSYSGDDHQGKAIAQNVLTYDPKVFPCYQSYATKDAKEIGFMKHINILKHPIFYTLPLLIAFVLYMFFYKSSFASGDIFGTKKVQQNMETRKNEIQTKVAVQPVRSSSRPVAARSPLVIPPLVVPEYSKYVVDGYIKDNGKYIIQVNGSPVVLPHKDILSFSPVSRIAMVRTSAYGEQLLKSGASGVRPQAPVDPPKPNSDNSTIPAYNPLVWNKTPVPEYVPVNPSNPRL
jgi:zona occludens toxin